MRYHVFTVDENSYGAIHDLQAEHGIRGQPIDFPGTLDDFIALCRTVNIRTAPDFRESPLQRKSSVLTDKPLTQTRQRIVEFLAKGAAQVHAVAEHLGEKRTRVSSTLSLMGKDGIIRLDGRLWSLVQRGEQPTMKRSDAGSIQIRVLQHLATIGDVGQSVAEIASALGLENGQVSKAVNNMRSRWKAVEVNNGKHRITRKGITRANEAARK